MRDIGIECEITVPGRIATVDLPHVKAENERILTPMVLTINEALQNAGLLGTWRAKTGGTTTERWILLIGKK